MRPLQLTSTVASGISNPTSIAFIGPNDILVLEKNTGIIKRVKNGVLLPGSLLDLSVATDSERGLLGIGVTNVGTSTTQFNVFLYYTAASSDGGTAISNRLSKYTLAIDATLGGSQGRISLSSVLLNLPVTPGPNHDGGKVLIGPDSNVYVVIGDVNRNTQAQNFETGPAPDGTGGILRVTQGGQTVGSGIIGSSDPLNKYFAYGVRNSFGLDFDPVTKKLWDTENGPSSNDELNLADPGFNSGWKDLMGFAPSGFNFNNLANFGGKGIYSDPEFVWAQVVAPTALKFFDSSKPGSSYQNDLFVGDYNKGRIYDFNLNSARTGLSLSGSLADKIANTDTEAQGAVFGDGFGGITDLKVGPGDGYLYVLSYGNGAIYKVTAGATDITPPTVVSTKPANAATGVAVSSTVTANFSEAVQGTTVTTSTFILKSGTNPNFPGLVTLSQDGKKATFSPSSSLAASTTYNATVTTGVKDLAGNALAANKVWSFTTAAGDTTPPTVTTKTPADAATGVAVSSSATATFSEALQSTTVTGTTFTLKPTGGASISGTVTYDAPTKTATFKPAAALIGGTPYTATLTNGIKDLAGNSLVTTSWSFTTAASQSSSCDSNLPVNGATSSGNQNTFPPTNAIDNNINTKWYSTFIVNPWIRLDLGAPKSICSVDIAWADGASRQYSFFISVSGDGTNFNTVFTGKSSGTTASPQKYSFAEAQARFVKITITQSHAGSATSIAQISEIDVFGKTSTSGVSATSESHSNSKNNKGSPSENKVLQSSTVNHRPIAKDDTIKTKMNTQVIASILDNDFDQDGDKLSIISVSKHTKNGGTVTLGNNGSVSVLPAPNFVGLDTFSYTISDGKGKTDKAKVTIVVTEPAKSNKSDVSIQQEIDTKNQKESELQQKNPADNNNVLGNNHQLIH